MKAYTPKEIKDNRTRINAERAADAAEAEAVEAAYLVELNADYTVEILAARNVAGNTDFMALLGLV